MMRDAYVAACQRHQNCRDHWPEQKRGGQPDGLESQCEKAREDDKDRPLPGRSRDGRTNVDHRAAFFQNVAGVVRLASCRRGTTRIVAPANLSDAIEVNIHADNLRRPPLPRIAQHLAGA
jgi:hypothetical protein